MWNGHTMRVEVNILGKELHLKFYIEVRDSPHGIFGSWARWTRAPPRFQSSWETAAAAAAVVAVPRGPKYGIALRH